MQANATASVVTSTEIALSLLQIVALLLPLAGIFFQLVLRSEGDESLPGLQDIVTVIGVGLFAMVAAGLFSIVQLFLSGLPLALNFVLLYLAGAFAATALIVAQLHDAFTDTIPIPAIRKVGPESYWPRRQQTAYERMAEESDLDED